MTASPDVLEARDVLLRWARGFGPTQVIYDGDRRVGSVREVVERALAALPAAPAGLDVERLAVAMNDAGVTPDELRLGRDLSVPAKRIAAAYAEGEPTE
jgi:hypothetical protein